MLRTLMSLHLRADGESCQDSTLAYVEQYRTRDTDECATAGLPEG